MSICTLKLADSVVLTARGGPPEAEYALFDAGEIELSATEPGRIREVGYRTIVVHARSRLSQLGITPEAAEHAAASFKPEVLHAYARGPVVRQLVDQLGPGELFDGHSLDAATGRYYGAWLDLGALVDALGIAHAAPVLQALHLAVLLAEHADDTPVVLETAQINAGRRPGERTYKRVHFEAPRTIAAALRTLKVPPNEQESIAAGPSRADVLARFRERANAGPAARERLASMESALESRETPRRGPLAEAELWALERKLSTGDATGIAERLDALDRSRGRLPGTLYLRARLALMNGSEPAKEIAERVSALSTSMAEFHELQLLASQAWAAAGDARRARAFARDLIDNQSASDVLRMHALQVLDTTGKSSGSLDKIPAAQAAAALEAPRAPGAPSGEMRAALPYSNTEPSAPRATAMDSGTKRKLALTRPNMPRPDVARSSIPHSRGWRMHALPPGASLPPYRIESDADESPTAPGLDLLDARVEALHALSLPAGLEGHAPPADDLPHTPAEARLSCTYLARELARELQLKHGAEPLSDVAGLELAQRYLREALVEDRVTTPEDEREVMRVAAFVSELLARRLGARWVKLDSPDPGTWEMLIACRTRENAGIRVWPIGRVLRFVAMGHKERDLVSYLLELEALAR